MQNSKNTHSIVGKSLNWIANHTYRKIPTLINSYQKSSTSLKKLRFQDYILTPSLARQAGLMYVRQLRRDYIKQKQDIQKVISQYKSNVDLMKQKPHQLLCPICLQLFSGPVTTSCNHTFCRMCIDESILFNPNCPSCRKSIRAQQLIVSKATQAIIRMLLYKLDIQQVEKFVRKQLQYQQWLQRRTPKRQKFYKGQLIDVRDTQQVWCHGSIIEILPSNVNDPDKYEYLLVHYNGWASRFDQVIPLGSLRLATQGFYLSRYEIPHYNLDPNNNEHYRCPVVTGPPQPPPPPQPMFADSSSSSSYETVERIQMDVNYNQLNNDNNRDQIPLGQVGQANSQPHFQIMNQEQDYQSVTGLRRDHSLPEIRLLTDLLQREYGGIINNNSSRHQEEYIFQSQVNQQIIDQINLENILLPSQLEIEHQLLNFPDFIHNSLLNFPDFTHNSLLNQPGFTHNSLSENLLILNNQNNSDNPQFNKKQKVLSNNQQEIQLIQPNNSISEEILDQNQQQQQINA